MNSSSDDRLDRLLEDWAGKCTVSAEDLASLKQRTIERLNSGSAMAVELPPPSTRSRRFVAAGLAVAALLLVSLGVWRYHPWQLSTDNRPQFMGAIAGYDSSETFEGYWSKHLRRQGQLLMECHQVYGHGVTWVAETEQSCDVGLAATDAENGVPSEYVVIQLWLVASNPQNGHSEVQTISVLVGREEWVEIPAAVDGRS